MNIAIWGTKREAVYFADELEAGRQHKVIGFVDNDERKWGSCINGKIVFSIRQLKELYPHKIDTVVLAIRNGYYIACILKQLRQEGISHVGLFKPFVFDFNEGFFTGEEEKKILWMDRLKKPLIPYLQIILTAACNLSCKGCTHFANIYNYKEDKHTYDIDTLKRNIQKFSENTEVFRLRLLGGEPLLYQDLNVAMETVHRFFPNSDIRLVTNGLLLLKLPNELLDCIRQNNIGLDISPYKPTVEIKERIVSVLEEAHIKYNFEGIEDGYIETFEKNISIKGENNPADSMAVCHHKQCLTLMQGKIYKCPFAAFSQDFFEYFSVRGCGGKGYDIDKEITNWEALIDRLYMNPIDSCKYCSDKVEIFEWKNKRNPEYIDWTVL